MTLTGGSLFSGAIDGLGLAASIAGFDILFHVEYDDWRRKVLEKHASKFWPNAQQFKDIETLETAALPRLDVLFGGFPCEDVSLAGNRAGLGEGTRSGLWWHFRRLIGDLRPRAVVVENTPGLLSLGGTTVIRDLAALGYVGRWGIISAADAGAPHLRERIFIVAYAVENRQPRPQSESRQGADPQEWRDPLHQSENNRQRIDDSNQIVAGSSVHGTLADTNERRRAKSADIAKGAGHLDQRRYPDGCDSQVARNHADESRLGRNAHGSAARLDKIRGVNNSDISTQIRPRIALPNVQSKIGTSRFQGRKIRNSQQFHQKKILQQAVRLESIAKRGSLARQSILSLPQTGGGKLRNVRYSRSTARPPHRRESIQQYPIEPDDIVRKLSYKMALRAWGQSVEETTGLLNLWEALSCLKPLQQTLFAIKAHWDSLPAWGKHWVINQAQGRDNWPAGQYMNQFPHEPPRVVPPRTSPDRTRRVEAIGDAVVWQAVYPIFYYLYEVLS